MYKNKKDMYKNQMERWKRRKVEAVKYKGGCCSICGYCKSYAALHFHHKAKNEKEFVWTKLRLRSWNSITKELDKCDLLCSNCHYELHYPELLSS